MILMIIWLTLNSISWKTQVIVGDFNIHLEETTQPDTVKFLFNVKICYPTQKKRVIQRKNMLWKNMLQKNAHRLRGIIQHKNALDDM